MRTIKYGMPALLTLSLLVLASQGEEKDKPKYTIKEVMKKAHKDGLLKKVASGKADEAEKKELAELYTALGKNKPPKGEGKEWDEKTEALIKAAKAMVEGKAGADKDLMKASNCMNCHSAHKGS